MEKTPMTVLYSAIPVVKLLESPLNPRRHFNQQKLEALAANVKEIGVKTPLLVRPIKDGKPWLEANGDLLNADSFEIAAGHRRSRAAVLAGLDAVPAVIQSMTDDAFIEILTVENLQREDIHPLDEAEGYRELLKRPCYDPQVIAAKIGKPVGYVQQRLCLLRLTAEARKAFWAGSINIAMALILAPLTPDDQQAALDRIFAKENWQKIKSSLQLHKWVTEELMMDLGKAAFDKNDPQLLPAAGACPQCPKRTGFLPELFPQIRSKDICTDRKCFEAKKTAYLDVQLDQIKAANPGAEPVLLSTDYESNSGTYHGAPVFGSSRWTEIKKKKGRCESAKIGLVIRGKERIGRTVEVCTNPRCSTHAGRHYRQQTPAELAAHQRREREQKIDYSARLLLLDRTAAAFNPEKITDADLRVIAVLAFERWGNSDARKAMSKARTATEDHHKTMPKWIETAEANDLLRLIFEAALRERISAPWRDSGRKDDLLLAAGRLGVDAAAIKTEVVTALRIKEKLAAARAKVRLEQKRKKEERAAARAKAAA